MKAKGPFSAFAAGWYLLSQHKRIWFWIWAIHLAGAAALAWTFVGLWDQLLGGRLAAVEFGGPQTANILVDLFAHHPEAMSRLLGGSGLLSVGFAAGGRLAGLAVLYLWLGAVLAGGILASLRRSLPVKPTTDAQSKPAEGVGDAAEDPSAISHEPAAGSAGPFPRAGDIRDPFLATFLHDCGRYLGRFSRLLVVQISVLSLVIMAVAALAGAVVDGLLGPYPDPAVMTRSWIVVLVLLALTFFVLSVIGDYAKVRMVREPRRSALLAWWAGLRWALPRLHLTLGLHMLFVLLTALVTAAYWWLAPGPASASGGTMVLLLMLQQAYLLFRAGLRVHWYGAELSLYDEQSTDA